MSRVLLRQSTYAYSILRSHVFELMETLDEGTIQPGARVLVKPNFLVAAPPETAVVTHPLVTRAVVEYVLQQGGRPQVSDSPAMGSFERVLRQSGTREALRDLPVVCKPFETSRSADIGRPFGRIDIAEDALDADVIINLPKLKTHNLTGMTLGVKNLFGCVVGLQKPGWHVKMGTNVEMLCRLFILLHERLKPRITLLDGILALEGAGPGRGGTPRPVGVLLAATDTYRLDEAACRLVGVDPERLPISRLARNMGFVGDTERAFCVAEGEVPTIVPFKLPATGTSLGAVGVFQGVVRRFLLAKPVIDSACCNLCGACRAICPASAITEASHNLVFDYNRCIRCYCCTEVCPQGALRVRESVPGRILTQLKKHKCGQAI